MAGVSSSSDSRSLLAIPSEVQRLVLAQLGKEALLTCRLVCKTLSVAATELAFRHVELLGEHAFSVASFLCIAKDEHLCMVVREVTCDPHVDVEDRYSDDSYEIRGAFLAALPRLGRFRGLRTLNLRFSERTGRAYGDDRLDFDLDDIWETADFRFHMLNTVFHALAGTWERSVWDNLVADLELDADHPALDPGPSTPGLAPIALAALTVSDLSDFNDIRLTKQAPFQTMLSVPSLQSLKLLITHREHERPSEDDMRYPDVYEMHKSLPTTWLAPEIAQNLRVLSLYDRWYWGFCPKMDLRLVNPNGGGFPNLRVLALGNYVISHDWQVDWIASLVVGARRGEDDRSDHPRRGLEELYLDDCPILWRARVEGPVDRDGYPRADVMHSWGGGPDLLLSFPLRWHKVLPRWRDAFAGSSSLRVFAMGSGDWNGGSAEPDGRRYNEEFAGRRVFLNYDLPPPQTRYHSLVVSGNSSSRGGVLGSRCGAGLFPAPGSRLPYVAFEIGMLPTPWIEDEFGMDEDFDEEYGEAFGEDTRDLDEEAMADFRKGLCSVSLGLSAEE
ncbi:hypothetical protein RB595_010084 [Gaeumannomyces hyphopodioides]